MSTRRTIRIIIAAMLCTALLAHELRPEREMGAGTLALSRILPHQFGEWHLESDSIPQVDLAVKHGNDPTTGERPTYDDVFMGTYINDRGSRVMFALAYARRQRQEVKIHRPELCYLSQGFEVTSLGERQIALSGNRVLLANAMFARNASRAEPVIYWIRVGNHVPHDSLHTRWDIFVDGLHGYVPDGLLVRASSLVDSHDQIDRALKLEAAFLISLYQAATPAARRALTGNVPEFN